MVSKERIEKLVRAAIPSSATRKFLKLFYEFGCKNVLFPEKPKDLKDEELGKWMRANKTISDERFLGILIEHFAGKFPLWLSPIQARILTVADRFEKYANSIKEEFEKNNLRVEVDARTESVGYKVREAQAQKIPLILTVGEKEEKNNTLAVRTLDNKVYFDVKIDDLVKKAVKNIEERKVSFGILI